MNKKDLAIKKINNLGYEILSIEKINYIYYISFKTNDNFKIRIDIYSILKENFDINKYLLVGTNIYSAENSMILAKKDNKYNSQVLNIDKQFAIIKCGICKNEYKQHIKTFLSSPHKICNKCRSKQHTTKLLNEDKVFKDIEENYNFKVLPNQHYHGNQVCISIMDNEGYKGKISYSNIRNGAKISKFAKYNPYALENINKYIKDNGIDCKLLQQKYQGWGKPLKLQCSCGKNFTASIDHLIHDKQTQCKECTKSKSNNEKTIENWLKQHNIYFIEQYKFQDCYYKKVLPFDFYIPNFNTLIEVDGELHFSNTSRFCNLNKKQVQQAVKEQQKRDDIKNKYCEKHNICLIRISYKEIQNNNYKNILSQKFIKE